MRKLTLVILITTLVYAGDSDRIDNGNEAILILQGFYSEGYNSIGFSNINHSEIMDIGSGNPAAISQFSTLSVGLKNGYSSKINDALFDCISVEKENNLIPVSAGIAGSFRGLNIGFAFHRKYSCLIDFGKVEVTTIENMDGTGEYYLPKYTTTVHSYSGIAAYSLKEVFKKKDKLSVGLQLAYNNCRENCDMSYYDYKYYGDNISLNFGAVYRYGTRLNFGLVWESPIKIKGDIGSDDSMEDLIDEDDEWASYNYVDKFTAHLPGKLAFGISVNPTEKWLVSASFVEVFWGTINDNYKNSQKYSLSTIYECSKYCKLSCGIYTSKRKYDYYPFGEKYDLTGLNGGVKIPFGSFDIVAIITDSHLFSSADMKTTSVEFGLVCNLK